MISAFKVSGPMHTCSENEHIVAQFGAQLITSFQLERLTKITGKPLHHLLKRKKIFAHRDLDVLLDLVEQKKPFYLFTGRGASTESLHLGHLIPMQITQYFQSIFGCKVVIQMADDEKYFMKDLQLTTLKKNTEQNIKQIIACGFDPAKTFIFQNSEYKSQSAFDCTSVQLQKAIPLMTFKKVFGFTDQQNIGAINAVVHQISGAFARSFVSEIADGHCVAIYSIDQDPYFRLARDYASTLNSSKPICIIGSFLPGLNATAKASSSVNSEFAIFLSDKPASVIKKIKKSFSGSLGDGTLQSHTLLGGNTNTDVAFKYLEYFEENETEFEDIKSKFISGKLTCLDLKHKLTTKLVDVIGKHTSLTEQLSLIDLQMFQRFQDQSN